jgi:hypothetical protein
MISQRAARPSGSVERLQQLSLSNLRGVDETRAPTDRFSVFSATNFVNNLDGSFSLRKPLLIKRDWTRIVKALSGLSDVDSIVVTRIIPLYTESDFLILFKVEDVNCFTIYNSKTKSFAEKCMLKWHDVSDVEHVKTMFDSRAGVAASQLAVLEGLTDLTAGSVFHANTATTIGNCSVKLNSDLFVETVGGTATKYPMCDVSLYDSTTVNGVLTISKPRYIQFYFDLGTWYFSIHNPAVNTFEANSDTGTYEHPLDTTLDDMYALRDTYSATVPAVKQIVPYVYTVRERNKTYPKKIDVSETVYDPNRATATGTALAQAYCYKAFLTATDTPEKTLYKSDQLCIDLKTDFSIAKSMLRPGLYDWTLCAEMRITVYEDIDSLKIHTYNGSVYGGQLKFENGSWTSFAGYDGTGCSLNSVDITRYTLKKGDVIVVDLLKDYTAFDIDMSYDIEGYEYYAGRAYLAASIEYAFKTPRNVSSVRVSEITESLKLSKFRGANTVPNGSSFTCFLKAFCNFPNTLTTSKYYATWLYSLDGRSWENMLNTDISTDWGFADSITVEEQSEEPIKSVSYDKDSVLPTVDVVYAPFTTINEVNDTKRVDLLKISEEFLENYFTNASFRFKIVLVEDGKIVATYGQADYVPIRAAEGQYWHSDLGNSVLGEKVYHKGRIFSFGDPSLKNNVFVSYPGEFVTPFKNIIDVNASKDVFVTAVVPWKDYLILTTPQAIYLASQVDTGYLTKTVNTALGISQYDARCITPTLNGLIFKSENKIYMLYPNVYAGDDSVINVTEISKPVENFLFEHEPNPNVKPFAFGTESEYVLVLPEENCSKCLVYNYTTKLWNCLQFPVVFQYHVMYSLTDIVLFGNNSDGGFCEYNFNKSFAEAYGLTDNQIDYGDVLVEPEDGIEEGVADVIAGYASPITVSPIEFELDTGQKTDAILTTKQFVESKMVFATLSPNDSFPMQILIHIDGDPHLVTQDISTDAPFWENSSSGGALNTTFGGVSNESDNFNILRQLVVRYSGKGKSIRHILTGESLYNFKLYETYIRYKLLNVKQ